MDKGFLEGFNLGLQVLEGMGRAAKGDAKDCPVA